MSRIHHVGLFLLDALHGFDAVRLRFCHVIAFFFQLFRIEQPDVLLVIDDQNLGHGLLLSYWSHR
jgi:hypothetical protein